MVAPLLAIIAVTHRAPRRTDARAATREEEVVVQLVFGRRGPASADDPARRGALDRDHHRRVVFVGKNVSAEAIRVGFPAKRITLQTGIK